MKFIHTIPLVVVALNMILSPLVSLDKKNEPLTQAEKDALDWDGGKLYEDRSAFTQIKSPFRNLILLELQKRKRDKQRIEEELLAEQRKKDMLQKLDLKPTEETNTNDNAAIRDKIINDTKKSLIDVETKRKNREYEKSLTILTLINHDLNRYDIDIYKDKIINLRKDIEEEKKDWGTINSIVSSLEVQAIFVSKGRRVALIYDNAVEEGKDLNEELGSIDVKSPVILTNIGDNSIQVSYKIFVLKKEIVDKDY